MKIVIFGCIGLIAILVTCIVWACVSIAGRDGEYHKCDVIVTYHYNQPFEKDECEWQDESKEVLIVNAYRTYEPTRNNTNTVHIYNSTALETKEGIIWVA